MRDNTKGILYIAINKIWTKEANSSAKSVKKTCPNLPITLITNKKFKSDHVDNFDIYPKISGTRFKFNYLDKTPYDYTLFLDSDTMMLTNIVPVFDVLDKFDIAMCICICRVIKRYKNKISDYRNVPDSFCPFNSGVIFYKKTEKVMEFISLWKKLYYKFNKEYNVTQDQISLRVALWNSNLRIHTLPLEYNIKNYGKLKKFRKQIKPKIIHDHKLYDKGSRYISSNFKLA